MVGKQINTKDWWNGLYSHMHRLDWWVNNHSIHHLFPMNLYGQRWYIHCWGSQRTSPHRPKMRLMAFVLGDEEFLFFFRGEKTVVGNVQQRFWHLNLWTLWEKTHEHHLNWWEIIHGNNMKQLNFMWNYGTPLDLMIEKCWTPHSSHDHSNYACGYTKKN